MSKKETEPATIVFDNAEELRQYLQQKADIITISKEICDEYKKAIANPVVDKPLAYSIFQVWKRVDAREESRWKKMREVEDADSN